MTRGKSAPSSFYANEFLKGKFHQRLSRNAGMYMPLI